jgi:murein DD-endopeptidase MepM/ murein hydrolase activator NlpD
LGDPEADSDAVLVIVANRTLVGDAGGLEAKSHRSGAYHQDKAELLGVRLRFMRIAWFAVALLCSAPSTAEQLYRLPWPEGLSFMITQAPGGRITTHFTKATLHAVDIAMPEGVPILAARAGVIEAVEMDHGASPHEDPLSYEGNFVRVRQPDGSAAIYAHLKHRGVAAAVGERVEAGQLLGYSGSTGEAAEPHLHFAVIRTERNASGWQEDVSLPIMFYVGVPPIAFPPRAALRVTANYLGAAEVPRAPSEGEPLSPWMRRPLEPGEEQFAWELLALWLACGVAALAWFWRFSRT